MKKITLAIATLIFCAASVAYAADSDHTTPGTPGQANCKGQTMAFFAQYGKNHNLPYRGVAGYAAAHGLTIAQVEAAADFHCSH
ncbi:MAG: hypothetical protein ABJB49_10555 [Nitrospirota bacterium]